MTSIFHDVKVIFFDWDGTLVDSKDVIVESFKRAAQDMGIELDFDKVRRLIGLHAKYIVKFSVKSKINDHLINEVVKKRMEYFKSLWRYGMKLYDDVRFVLSKLKEKGMKLGVVSTTRDFLLKEMISYFNLNKYFDIVLGLTPELRPKPHSDLLEKACKELSISPQECIYVGDSYIDCLTARSIGMKFILIIRDEKLYFQRNMLRKVLIINSLYDMLKYLN